MRSLPKPLLSLCISFKSWNQEHPIQLLPTLYMYSSSCVYPSNLESRTSYTTNTYRAVPTRSLRISFKSWNQEHPIQPIRVRLRVSFRCVYPSNLEIKNILYNNINLERAKQLLCISFKSWNQEHPIQPKRLRLQAVLRCVYPSNLEIKSILYNVQKIMRLLHHVVYILQILKSRTSYTTGSAELSSIAKLCISFKSWNQEHPIQLLLDAWFSFCVVYILQILKSRTSYTTG